jgi:hypothetical protein
MSWQDECGNCSRQIPSRGNHRRRVPRLGGKVKIVCADCAREIDAQDTLLSPDGTQLGARERKSAEGDTGRLDARAQRARRAA